MNTTPDKPENVDPRLCPQCGQTLVNVGTFWVCPSHGQVPEPKLFTALRIFLSYGHDANEELVRRIKADLEERGHDVWFDKTDIKAGDDWRRAITDGILRSQRVVSFLSKHSTRDPGVCRDEIAIAIGVKGGNIQTILVESETEVQPPVNIGHIQWLDMHDWKELRAAGEAIWEHWYQTKLAEIVRVVESDESRRFAGEIETLHGHLKPIKSDARIYDLLRKGFFGRTWLFKAVEKWRHDSKRDSRLFWITGDPGVGKSAFAAQLAHTRADAVIAAQFVEWDKPDHRDARRVVRSLAFQLATRLPDYRKLVLALPEIAELDRKDPAELFDYLLANPLRSVIGGGRERQLIVIDALDEAGEAGHNPLVEMLARHATRLPEWLGLLITSRPDEEVQTPLQGLSGLKPLILNTGHVENLADIRDYLRHQLPDAADAAVNVIVTKSDGVFLYAEYVCEELRHNRLSLARLDEFPHGLGGIYAQYFARQFPNLDSYKNTTRYALGLLVAARESLEPGFLAKFMEWNDYQLNDFLNSLGSLIKQTDGKLHPFHKSLFDWVTEKRMAGSFYVSKLEGHRMLAKKEWEEYQQDPENMTAYTSNNIAYHLAGSEWWDKLQEILLDERLPFLPAWREINCLPNGWDFSPFLNRALSIVKAVQDRRRSGTPDDYEDLYSLFHALSQSASSRTASLFFETIAADRYIPGVFRSSFSDVYAGMHINLRKLNIYECVKLTIQRLVEQKVAVPDYVIAYRKELQTSCLYCESEYLLEDTDLINEVANNRGFIFRGDIDEVDKRFNTFSLVIEVLAKDPDEEFIGRLVEHGADLNHRCYSGKTLKEYI